MVKETLPAENKWQKKKFEMSGRKEAQWKEQKINYLTIEAKIIIISDVALSVCREII